MNALPVHRSRARSPIGLTTTTSPTIIDNTKQTPMCGPWRWRIPKLHIASVFRSLYFRLRGRTPVTMITPTGNDGEVSTAERSPTSRRSKVEPLRPTAFSTRSGTCLQSSIGNKSSQVPLSSLMSGIRDISMPSCLSIPGVVGESEVYNLDRPVTSKSNCETLIYPPADLDSDRTTDDLATEADLTDYMIDNESKRNSNNDRDIIEVECEDSQSEDKAQHLADILEANSPSSSPTSETGSDVDISFQDNGFDMDEAEQPRPFSRMGRECWEGQESATPSPVTEDTEAAGIGSSADFSKPVDTEAEISWVKSEEMADDPELEDELDYYDNNNEDGDDYLDMDKVLRKCPPTEVLQNLRDMVQLSKNTTSQLEKALRRAARISCGPFPRLPGSGFTKSEVINAKCQKLLGETEDFLGEMNKNFLTFYTVLEQMDKVSVRQDSFFSSIMVQRGPRDWRRGHAAILQKMDKLWSRVYPKVITRKLKGRIQETIYEENGE